jgi:hypothetical protein
MAGRLTVNDPATWPAVSSRVEVSISIARRAGWAMARSLLSITKVEAGLRGQVSKIC